MKGNPNGGPKKIQKGQVLNPRGQLPRPPEWHLMKRITKGEFEVLMNNILKVPVEELRTYGKTSLESVIASFVYHAYKTGDPSKIETILNRLFGKVPDKLEVSESERLKEMPDDELIKEAERLTEERKQLIAKEKLNV